MNSRLYQMIQDGRIPNRGGQWIDTYSQVTHPSIAGTILAGIQRINHYYVMVEQIQIPANTKSGVQTMDVGGVCDLSYPTSTTRRGRVQDDGNVAPAITCGVEHTHRRIEPGFRVRKLTPRECFRLMDVREEDIDILLSAGIPETQLTHLAGNSIVVSCLYHIFDKLFIHPDQAGLTLL